MTDSPAVPPPSDPRELPILERLLSTRDALLLLKQDKSTYIKSGEVISFYDQVIELVRQLNAIRVDGVHERSRGAVLSTILTNERTVGLTRSNSFF